MDRWQHLPAVPLPFQESVKGVTWKAPRGGRNNMEEAVKLGCGAPWHLPPPPVSVRGGGQWVPQATLSVFAQL